MTYAAFLRAINVGGANKVSMDRLKAMLVDLGFAEMRSWLQSGNLAFQSDPRETAALEELLERQTSARLGLQVDFMVRTGPELDALVQANPFREEALADPSHLLVLFAKSPFSAESVESLQSSIQGREVVRGAGRELYAVYPDGIGASKLTGAVLERRLGVRVTGRNWNTVLKLRELTRPF